MGLYLARGIITRQRGYISVKSKVGEGTTFSVYLLRNEVSEHGHCHRYQSHQNLRPWPPSGEGLDGVTLGVEKGKFTAIVGASGSGKTTLLHCIGGLYRPDSGTVTVDGQDLAQPHRGAASPSTAGARSALPFRGTIWCRNSPPGESSLFPLDPG